MRPYLKYFAYSLIFIGCMSNGLNQSLAQDGTEGLHKACLADMAKFCSAVNLGEGRMLACLYAHEDQISEQCDEAVADTSDMLDSFMFTLNEALGQCAKDIETTCSGVAAGGGRILSCLKKNAPKVSAECNQSVGRLTEYLED